YNIKYIRDIKMFDKLYYHINKNHIDKIIETDDVVASALEEEESDDPDESDDEADFLLRYPHEIIGVYEN
ncbi:MAG: hypothetical protein ACKPKO_44090, partial [Candidatus Fonsibacter sp.]